MSIVEKQLVSAMILVILGLGLTQLEDSGSFYPGIGFGTIAIASIWLMIRIIIEIKKK